MKKFFMIFRLYWKMFDNISLTYDFSFFILSHSWVHFTHCSCYQSLFYFLQSLMTVWNLYANTNRKTNSFTGRFTICVTPFFIEENLPLSLYNEISPLWLNIINFLSKLSITSGNKRRKKKWERVQRCLSLTLYRLAWIISHRSGRASKITSFERLFPTCHILGDLSKNVASQIGRGKKYLLIS